MYRARCEHPFASIFIEVTGVHICTQLSLACHIVTVLPFKPLPSACTPCRRQAPARCTNKPSTACPVLHEWRGLFKAPKHTWMVLRKLRGSAGSSKGYAPTSMTYNVTPQLHTSAISPSYCLRDSTCAPPQSRLLSICAPATAGPSTCTTAQAVLSPVCPATLVIGFVCCSTLACMPSAAFVTIFATLKVATPCSMHLNSAPTTLKAPIYSGALCGLVTKRLH